MTAYRSEAAVNAFRAIISACDIVAGQFLIQMKLFSQQIPWKRLTAEGVAIVVSILLAFWIDAWWDERRDRNAEEKTLSALLGELREFDQVFEDNAVFVAAIRQSAIELLEASAGPGPDLSDRDIDRLISDVTWYVDTEVLSLPVLQSAVSGGQLAAISDIEIGQMLGEWLIKISAVNSSIRFDFDFYRGRLMPFLDKNASILQIYNVPSHRPGFPESEYPNVFPPNTSVTSHRELLTNREFQNILIGRVVTLTNIVEWRVSDVQTELREIIGLIETELGY